MYTYIYTYVYVHVPVWFYRYVCTFITTHCVKICIYIYTHVYTYLLQSLFTCTRYACTGSLWHKASESVAQRWAEKPLYRHFGPWLRPSLIVTGGRRAEPPVSGTMRQSKTWAATPMSCWMLKIGNAAVRNFSYAMMLSFTLELRFQASSCTAEPPLRLLHQVVGAQLRITQREGSRGIHKSGVVQNEAAVDIGDHACELDTAGVGSFESMTHLIRTKSKQLRRSTYTATSGWFSRTLCLKFRYGA